MSPEVIPYFEDLPIGIEIRGIDFHPWHRHMNAIEIMLVLRGTLEITMSCDNFTLKQNEVTVMNMETFHNVKGLDEENVVISLYINLNYYEKYFQYIKYIVFILENINREDEQCRKQTLEDIRKLITRIVIEIDGKQDGFKERILEYSKDILTHLINVFNEVRFYNMSIKFNSIKIERYYLIKKYIDENFCNKTVLEDVSNKEFFCKSYLSHLFRDVSTFSLKDITCFIRNWKSEELLLSTKKSVNEISEECGYSDPKYYYKHFRKWYECTPSAYRRRYRKELNEKAEFVSIPTAVVINALYDLLNPSKISNLEIRQFAASFLLEEHILSSVDKDKAIYDWAPVKQIIDSYYEKQLNPFIAIRYKSRTWQEWKTILKQYAETFGKKETLNLELWLIYDEFELNEEINCFIGNLEAEIAGINIKSMLTNSDFLK